MSLACRYLSRRRRLPTSISSPRREWWSLECVRRCSVSSLMRAVSSATWTRVLPVSFSFWPNCETISRLRSWVRLMRRVRLAALGSPDERAGGLDVAAHLLDERVHGGNAALAAQAREELDGQAAVVQVAVEVDQVGLAEDVAA